jgi:tRNA(Ile)-lysidine synthase
MASGRSAANETQGRHADALTRGVEQALSAFAARGAGLCVGLSGGIDSVVLLDIVATLAPRHAWRTSALHVNHQLSPHAPEWTRFCRRLCRACGVPLRVVKVDVERGDSIEGGRACGTLRRVSRATA